MPVAHGNEIIAVFREAHGLHFARHFVGRDLNIAPPVPDIDDHVVLRADRDDVLVAGRKGLREKDRKTKVSEKGSTSSTVEGERQRRKGEKKNREKSKQDRIILSGSLSALPQVGTSGTLISWDDSSCAISIIRGYRRAILSEITRDCEPDKNLSRASVPRGAWENLHGANMARFHGVLRYGNHGWCVLRDNERNTVGYSSETIRYARTSRLPCVETRLAVIAAESDARGSNAKRKSC